MEKFWEPTFCSLKTDIPIVALKFSKRVLVPAYCFFKLINYLFPISMKYSKHTLSHFMDIVLKSNVLICFFHQANPTSMAASLRLPGLARKIVFNKILLLTSFLGHIWHQILSSIVFQLETVNFPNSSKAFFSGFSLFPFIYAFRLVKSFLRLPIYLPTSINTSQHILTVVFF